MTLDEFVKQNKDRHIDFDNAFGAQCMDLYRFYVRDVLSYPQSKPVVGAKDVWNNYLKDYYKRIKNTLDAVPKKGDIIIWGEKYGVFGHIAIFLEGNIRRFTAFSQNDPIGSACIIKEYRYNHVLGWLHPIEETIVEINDQTKIAIGGEWGAMEVQAIRSTLNDQRRNIQNLQGTIKNINDSLEKKDIEMVQLSQSLAKTKEGLQILSRDREELMEKIEKLKKKEPVFNNPIAGFIYKIAKRLG